MVALDLALDALEEALEARLGLGELRGELLRERVGGGRLLGPARDVGLERLLGGVRLLVGSGGRSVCGMCL